MPMTKREDATLRRCAAMLLAFALLGVLAGCSMSDDTMASFLVAPGKYTLYNCTQLAEEGKARAARAQELEQLMARADVDASGRLVSTIAYRSEYLSVRGELDEVRRASAEKKCPNAAGGHASDTIIR
jgi:hypothetical protein